MRCDSDRGGVLVSWTRSYLIGGRTMTAIVDGVFVQGKQEEINTLLKMRSKSDETGYDRQVSDLRDRPDFKVCRLRAYLGY